MDANRFEGLAKAFSTSGTRRGILRLFTALPLVTHGCWGHRVIG
jgi:hypothetical protein